MTSTTTGSRKYSAYIVGLLYPQVKEINANLCVHCICNILCLRDRLACYFSILNSDKRSRASVTITDMNRKYFLAELSEELNLAQAALSRQCSL